MSQCRLAFCASTGRTATMFIATVLNNLPKVIALHEGHWPGDPQTPRLPLINLENRQSWYDPLFGERTVAEKRDWKTLSKDAGSADLLVDVAFYNAPLLVPLTRQHPNSQLLVILRRCEGFVRSATIIRGEDRQPAGWPDPAKTLTDREKFISLGRLMPKPGSKYAEIWPNWSAIERNIWLWYHVNSHLAQVSDTHANCKTILFENLSQDPVGFWTEVLCHLKIYSQANLSYCTKQSAKKINKRRDYQIGAFETWGDGERALYEQLARPLEIKFYDRSS